MARAGRVEQLEQRQCQQGADDGTTGRQQHGRLRVLSIDDVAGEGRTPVHHSE